MHKGFKAKSLNAATHDSFREIARQARGDILTMTTLAGCGHPGGSMSSIDMYITLYSCAAVYPDIPRHPERDRIVISHGHTSPGVYAALGRLGFFNPDDAIAGFRLAGTIFEGHVERCVPGVEWGTGNLGQGLSAGCGFALGARLNNRNYRTFVVMGDGEQQKGQISEARRFAAKYKLHNLTVLVDNNHLQISGNVHDIMPQDIKANFIADGWRVLEIDGHDIYQVYEALHTAVHDSDAPVAIIAQTIMSKGVSFMENDEKYHGSALPDEAYHKAMQELSLTSRLDELRTKRSAIVISSDTSGAAMMQTGVGGIMTGTPIQYEPDKKTDNRSAFGNALKDLARLNSDAAGRSKIAVFDCDLAGSVKTNGFASLLSDNFFEAGIQEHNTATMAGALSLEGIVPFFADFGVFGVCETYNQHRLNDINHSNYKLVCTHVGLDVGEDGKTHQCIDYIGLFQNLFGFKIIIPGDPNQTDKATRYICGASGNFLLCMGRSKIPVVTDEGGKPFFGDAYEFEYGKIDRVRTGRDGTIITCGCMLYRALQAREMLLQKGVDIGVSNLSCPKHIDMDAVRDAADTGLIITYEDHNVHTGIGSVVANAIAELKRPVHLVKMGVTRYGDSGTPESIFKSIGLDAAGLAATIEDAVAQKS